MLGIFRNWLTTPAHHETVSYQRHPGHEQDEEILRLMRNFQHPTQATSQRGGPPQ